MTAGIYDILTPEQKEVILSWICCQTMSQRMAATLKDALIVDLLLPADSPAREIPLLPFFFLDNMRKSAIAQALGPSV